MQKAQEATPESEAQSDGGLGLVDERGVIELQLVESVTQERVVRPVQRVEPGEHHWLGIAITTKCLGGTMLGRGNRVTNARLTHVLHSRDQVAHLADPERL